MKVDRDGSRIGYRGLHNLIEQQPQEKEKKKVQINMETSP